MRTVPISNAAESFLAAGCVVLAASSALAANALDFEGLPPGTTVIDQYAAEGVRFTSAYLATDPAARSGTRVLRTVAPTAEVFTTIPLKMSFDHPQARVRLYAAAIGSAAKGTLNAFDANGLLIAQDGPRLVAPNAFTTVFEIGLAAARIRRAELRLEGAAHFAIDDLEFDIRHSPQGPPAAQVIETRQPPARDNRAVSGNFPARWNLGPPPGATKGKPSAQQGEAEERFDYIESGPALERELAPGASADLVTRLKGRAGLAGSARWIGTRTPLPVTLSVNGSAVGSGKPYALGGNRGGADVGGVAEAGGEAKLSVTNTSRARVKVRLTLGVVRGEVH